MHTCCMLNMLVSSKVKGAGDFRVRVMVTNSYREGQHTEGHCGGVAQGGQHRGQHTEGHCGDRVVLQMGHILALIMACLVMATPHRHTGNIADVTSHK